MRLFIRSQTTQASVSGAKCIRKCDSKCSRKSVAKCIGKCDAKCSGKSVAKCISKLVSGAKCKEKNFQLLRLNPFVEKYNSSWRKCHPVTCVSYIYFQ